MARKVAAFFVMLLALSPLPSQATFCNHTAIIETPDATSDTAPVTETNDPLATYGYNAPDFTYCLGLSPPYNLAEYRYCFGLPTLYPELTVSGVGVGYDGIQTGSNGGVKASSHTTGALHGGTSRLPVEAAEIFHSEGRIHLLDAWFTGCDPGGITSSQEMTVSRQWIGGSGPPLPEELQDETGKRQKEQPAPIPVPEPATLLLLGSGLALLGFRKRRW